MTMEVLPESFFWDLIGYRDRTDGEKRALYGELSIILFRELAPGMAPSVTGEILAHALMMLMLSFYAELERRHRHFCLSVTHSEDPLNPKSQIHYVPRDPETFDPSMIPPYYQEMYRQRQESGAP